MALTGMQIYKSLPKTNCKDCGLPTCMAFAMQVAAKQRALTDCPHISEEGKGALSEASAPPQRLVKIGANGKSFEMGQETVMFRHEEKFHRPTGIAIRVPASLSDADAGSCIDEINKRVFTRVGKELKVALCAVEVDTADPAARAKLAAGKSQAPLILVSSKAESMKAAVEAIKEQKPLIYAADASNLDAFLEIAAGAKVPLAVRGSSLEDRQGQGEDRGSGPGLHG
jgi:acetyl-CoA decarbonylase/synthase complex subunit gamma